MSKAKGRWHVTGRKKVAMLRPHLVEKVALLPRHLVKKVTVSDLYEAHGFHPMLFYRWQKEWFEPRAPGLGGG